jgi:pimeloyl-ACP methyl ester carboxylesterase
MAVARARTLGRSRVIESPFGAIEYADEGSGPAVLVVHGSGGGFDQALAISAPLPRRLFRVIAPSRFGYLMSSMPNAASPEMQADALAWLMRALGIERAVVLGGSAGALCAVQLALRHPALCRGLVLAVPALFAPGWAPGPRADEAPMLWSLIRATAGSDFLFWAAMRLAPGFMTRKVLATHPAVLRQAPLHEAARARKVLFHMLPVSARKKGMLMDIAMAVDPPPFDIGEIECPMLVIATKDDLYGTAVPAIHAASRARDARLVLYDDGGHLWVGHDAALWGTVTEFVQALSSRS